jgi:predicted glycoside hydrolase/deacetylase ChbG (UPF0249 family)
MAKIILSIFFYLSLMISYAQQAPRLVVRGDDMGFSHSADEALIRCYKEGIETSVEVIVPSPWFPETVKLLKQNPGLDVGIHLAITSEWENIKWRPLSDCSSLKDSNGYFYPMVWPNKNYPGQSIAENKWTIADIEKEFRAQIEQALRSIPRISHLSSHMFCTGLSEEVKALTKKLAKEYHIANEPDYSIYPVAVGFGEKANTTAEKIKIFMDILNKMENGKTYIFIDHPGFNNEELRAIYHIGYEHVATDRQSVTDVFTNPEIKELIRQKGIQLISLKELEQLEK